MTLTLTWAKTLSPKRTSLTQPIPSSLEWMPALSLSRSCSFLPLTLFLCTDGKPTMTALTGSLSSQNSSALLLVPSTATCTFGTQTVNRWGLWFWGLRSCGTSISIKDQETKWKELRLKPPWTEWVTWTMKRCL